VPPTPGPASGPIAGAYPGWKSALDRILGLILLVATVGIAAYAMLLVRLTSRGPVIYRQTRLGLGGRLFTIYKIRTMYHDCERLTGAQWSKPGDPRVTPVGRILRATHIDELPQLLNVLRGEMSLVGPRPERPELATGLERALPGYRDRLAVRPGVTGLAQVQLPPDTDVEGVRRKLAHDVYYIRHFNLWLDLRIIVATSMVAFGLPYSVPRSLLRLPGGEAVELASDGAAAGRGGSARGVEQPSGWTSGWRHVGRDGDADGPDRPSDPVGAPPPRLEPSPQVNPA
jgi:lipopolysaccharide/colanic/teichoic acid biosynthesis glycosyltransferase